MPRMVLEALIVENAASDVQDVRRLEKGGGRRGSDKVWDLGSLKRDALRD